MRNRSTVWFQLTGIITLIYGIFSVLSYGWIIFPLIYIIPTIIAGTQFLRYAHMTEDQFRKVRTIAIIWSVFLLIYSPLTGLFGIIGSCQIPAKIQENKYQNNKSYNDNQTNQQEYIQEQISSSQKNQNQEFVDEQNVQQTKYDAKIEKINRLADLKERNVISEQEFEQLKNKIMKED